MGLLEKLYDNSISLLNNVVYPSHSMVCKVWGVEINSKGQNFSLFF
jgi:hypothetical protein